MNTDIYNGLLRLVLKAKVGIFMLINFDNSSNNGDRLSDIYMYQCGMEDCKAGHSYGPAVRDHFLIHYVLQGKGYFQIDGIIHTINKGEGFLICPDVVTFYQADTEDPWHYIWVGFNGLKAQHYLKQANLDALNPVFKYDKGDSLKDCMENMLTSISLAKEGETRIKGLLYLFLSYLIEASQDNGTKAKPENQGELYVENAIDYIDKNYSRKMTINNLANYIGVDRSYLCSIFKSLIKLSPQQFLILFRLEKACELMKTTHLSIGDISRSVGYIDPLLFSKTFKKVKGLSPKDFRVFIK